MKNKDAFFFIEIMLFLFGLSIASIPFILNYQGYVFERYEISGFLIPGAFFVGMSFLIGDLGSCLKDEDESKGKDL